MNLLTHFRITSRLIKRLHFFKPIIDRSLPILDLGDLDKEMERQDQDSAYLDLLALRAQHQEEVKLK